MRPRTVEAGIGATALSASVAAPSLAAGLLRRAPLDLPDLAFYAVSYRERRRSCATEAPLEIIAQAAPKTTRRRSARIRIYHAFVS